MTLDRPIETDPGMSLESADDAEFIRHVNDWIDQFRPETPFETKVIRHAAAVSWELEIAGRYEKACRIERIDKAVSACVNGSRNQIEHAKARASFDPSMEGERLRRHQTSLRRELRRDLELFAKPRLRSAKSNPTGSRESGVGNGESPLGAGSTRGLSRFSTPEAAESLIGPPVENGTVLHREPDVDKPPIEGLQQEDRGLTPPARQIPPPARQTPPPARQTPPPARPFTFAAALPTPLRPPADSIIAGEPQLRSSANRKARRPDPERLLREIRTGRRTKRVINLAPAAGVTQMLNVSASRPNRAVDHGPISP